MGIVKTASDLRLGRAWRMLQRGLWPVKLENGDWRVLSESGGKTYTCQLEVDEDNTVTYTRCTCPDFRTMSAAMWDCMNPPPGMPPQVHPGVSHTDYCPDCKHLKLIMLYKGIIEPPAYELVIPQHEPELVEAVA